MKITEIPAKPKEQKTIRVAAYARVSSDKDAAFHSLEAQTEYYQEYVAKHPDWELTGIYSDNGISGTIINRPEFQRMLEDCRAGKIDLVITKSITRFARNTVVLLETVRELKRLGIDCYFEKEDMHSISPDGELLLTLLAMYAEEEARSTSENQLWRIRKLYEQGKPAGGHLYGYRFRDGTFLINFEEAEVVKMIFDMYLSGMGLSKIAQELTLKEIEAPHGGIWSEATLYDMLRNEKYIGNMLLQKEYREDYRTKKKIVNHGEKRMYYVEGSHEPIISHDTFQRAQKEIKRRQKTPVTERQSNSKKLHLFTGLLRCAECEKLYQRKRTHAGKYDKVIWVCPNYHSMGKSICPTGELRESVLIDKTKEVLDTDSLDWNSLRQQIKEIRVERNHRLIYFLSDGTSMTTTWQHRSRSESWTPEMRQAARERALMQRKEAQTNAESDSH